MIAYSKSDLYNKYVQEQTSEAFRNDCIDEVVYRNILEKHPHKLYTPNFFIRIGLGVLTIVAGIFSLALIWLITGASSDAAITLLLIFFALLSYALLELMIMLKKYYNAGIDNTLMISIGLLIISAFLVMGVENSYRDISFTIMLVSLWLTIRFTDAFMAIICFAATIVFFCTLYIELGSFGEVTVPFALMIFSALVYLFIQKLSGINKLVIWKLPIQCVKLFSIIIFYIAGNYFVVNELSLKIYALPPAMGWVFWIYTLAVPPLYIFYGLKRKQSVFYRTGFVLLVAGILTVHYYYTVMPVEIAMIIFGILLIGISYALIKYLATPKKGFTFENNGAKGKSLVDAEALIIAQVFGKKQLFKMNQCSSAAAVQVVVGLPAITK